MDKELLHKQFQEIMAQGYCPKRKSSRTVSSWVRSHRVYVRAPRRTH